MIANSLDEGAKRIDVEISPSLNQVVVEDWGEGINKIDEFVNVGDPMKAKLGGEIIGEKDVGKLSTLKLGDIVEFRSNNGRVGYDIFMSDHFDYSDGAANEFLSHRGVKIIIPSAKNLPTVEDLQKYLKQTFGVRMATQGLQINLNGFPLKPKRDVMEDLLFRIEGGIDVRGNLRYSEKGKGEVDVHIKHIRVMPFVVDPSLALEGWANCNALKLTTNRNDIDRTSKTCRNFVENLREYCFRKFPKRQDRISHGEIILTSKLMGLVKSYFSNIKFYPDGRFPFGKGDVEGGKLGKTPSPTENPKKVVEPQTTVPPYVKIRTSVGPKKVKRTIRTAYGIQAINAEYGNEREPIFWEEPNMLIFNRTNDIFKFALESKPTLGPQYLRMLPYLARALVKTNPDSKTWNVQDMNLHSDEVMRFFLQEMDLLPN